VKGEERADQWLNATPKALVVIPSEARDLLLSRERSYFVYILANRSRNLYTGITNHLERRVYEHKTDKIPGFTTRYRIHQLVYFEPFGDVNAAIAREKQVKSWRREKRVALIEKNNPAWNDLSVGWYSPPVEYASLGVLQRTSRSLALLGMTNRNRRDERQLQ
jgi:putative endonuclease